MPRVNWMLEHDTKCTLSTLMWELHIAAQNDHVIEFTLVHQDSLIVANEGDQYFSLFVSFQGRISVDEQYRPQNLYSFPFYCCFKGNDPPWLYIPNEVFTPELNGLVDYYQERDPHHQHDHEERANND